MSAKLLSSTFSVAQKEYSYIPIAQAVPRSAAYQKIPYSIRILLESALRRTFLNKSDPSDMKQCAGWKAADTAHGILSFAPARILLQDLTGVPLVVDLASLRSAAVRAGKDPASINPVIPVDLVIDHSIQVDYSATPLAYSLNTSLEYSRNTERYQFLKWAQNSFKGFRVIPPASGIVHQVNLEYLSPVVQTSEICGQTWAYPDSVYGTDSHTPMISGMGVLAWGVGGIEAIAAMLGQPVEIAIPDVVGVNITGVLREGCTPSDAVLTLTHLLREVGVVDKIVEFYGCGLDSLSIPDRAMLANMAPEYGATTCYFPVDSQVLDYLLLTGREDHQVILVEKYFKTQGLFREDNSPIPEYSSSVEFDLTKIMPSLAGPRRPQDLVALENAASAFKQVLLAPVDRQGYGISAAALNPMDTPSNQAGEQPLCHGSIVLAAITSCTNTSNPTSLIYAGLLAKKAAELGLRPRSFVKTSFAPGSRAVVRYLEDAGLLQPLEALGFHVVGFGCTTCIGNSGPLTPEIEPNIRSRKLVTAAVISGNRNFEGRVHPLVQANYLTSPALVIAYSLAGNMGINLLTEPLGISKENQPVFLRDLWPDTKDVETISRNVVRQSIYKDSYAHIMEGDPFWQSIPFSKELVYPWDAESTYIREAPFAEILPTPITSTHLRILAILGDSITTDHISPAGFISTTSIAAKYLSDKGISVANFNTYGSRRGNHEVMARAAFANPRIKNAMMEYQDGPVTLHMPDGEKMDLYSAAQRYKTEGVGTVILAGKEYGTGSSRDWAAKGPLLLGVQAVIAQSFERIHRANLVGMGILPLRFQAGESASSLSLDGGERLIFQDPIDLKSGASIMIVAVKPSSEEIRFRVDVLLKSLSEYELWKAGGILRKYAKEMIQPV